MEQMRLEYGGADDYLVSKEHKQPIPDPLSETIAVKTKVKVNKFREDKFEISGKYPKRYKSDPSDPIDKITENVQTLIRFGQEQHNKMKDLKR